MIVTAKQLQEKYREQSVDLYLTFVNWKIMAKLGSPGRFIAMVWQCNDECLHGSRTMESTLNLSCDNRSPARLCIGTDTVQHDVLHRVYKCFSGL